MREDNKTEWIDQYLDDALQEQERVEFERLLEQDPALRIEVEAQKAVRRSLQDWGNKALKSKFKQFHTHMELPEDRSAPTIAAKDTLDQGKVRSLWSRTGVWTLAASISLLLLAGILWIKRDVLFNDLGTEIVALQTFQIPIAAKGAENMGYAGEETISDSVVVQIMSDPQYPFHYRFKDTLQIFSSTVFRNNEIMLEHQEQTDTYMLVIDEKRYLVERGFNRIRALKEE